MLCLEKRQLRGDINLLVCKIPPIKKITINCSSWGSRGRGGGEKKKLANFEEKLSKPLLIANLTIQIVKHWDGLHKKAVESPSPEVFKTG